MDVPGEARTSWRAALSLLVLGGTWMPAAAVADVERRDVRAPGGNSGGEGLESMSLEELLDVSVSTVSRRSEVINDAPGVTTVWTREEIRATGARTLQDLLKLLPGYDTFDHPDEGRHLAGVRGISAGSILVLLDGQRLNTSLDERVDIDLPLENIERIEAIRGPGSALYGTYAFTGVINVITRRPTDVDGIEVTGRGGMRNLNQERVTGEGRVAISMGKRFGAFTLGGFGLLVIDGGKSVTIPEDSETERERRLLDKYPNRWSDMPLTRPSLSAPQQSREAQRRGELDLNATWRGELSYQGKLLWERKEAIVGRTFVVNQGTEVERIRVLQQLAWIRRFALANRRLPELTVELRYHFDYQRDDNRYQDEPPGWNVGLRFYSPTWEIFPDGVLQKVQLSYLSNLVELKVDAPLRLLARDGGTPDFYVTVGASFEDARVLAVHSQANFGRVLTGPNEFNYDRFQNIGALRESEFFRHDPNRQAFLGDPLYQPAREIVAAYAQARWDVRSWFSAVGGVRFDHFSDFGLSINPRAALLFKPHRDLFIKALYGRAFNAPSFMQLYSATPQYTVMAGKPDLKPERIDTLELQLGYQRGPLRTTLTGYTFFIGDLIRRISVLKDFTGEEYRFDNLGGTSTGYGGELEAKLVLRFGLRLFANLSLQHVHYQLGAPETSDLPLSAQPVLLPEVKAAAGVNWRFARHLTIDVTVVVGSERTQAALFAADSAVRERQPAGAYAFANVALTADHLWDRLYLKLFVMDLFASGYRDYVLDLPQHLLRGTPELFVEAGLYVF